MDPLLIQYAYAVVRQIRRYWMLVASVSCVIAFAVLGIGMIYDPEYETSITIYSDTKNVIKPLLEGQAAVTTPKTERIRVVRETMFAPRILEKVVRAVNPDLPEEVPADQMERLMAQLRETVELSAPADDYIRVAFRDHRPGVSYRVVNDLANLFIEESASTKRAESQNAYKFIDEQVKSYKAQLVEAENKLKAFEAANVDGVESQVNSTISTLRSAIEDIAIDIQTEEVRVKALEEQLAKESRTVSTENEARVYRDRLEQMEARLNTLRLNYKDEHPDVIDLKLQIKDLKDTIISIESSQLAAKSAGAESTDADRLNPIYEELSNQLSAAKVNLQAMRHRLSANQDRLEDEYARRARVATNQAELSELTRDYSVTKGIYEDLLERKERARISMTLDLTGQGVTYKVLEPASYPRLPTGIRFLHFAIAGPIFALLIPMALAVVWIFIDPRIKFAQELNEQYPGIVLAVIPPDRSKYARWSTVIATIVGAGFVYCGAAASFHYL